MITKLELKRQITHILFGLILIVLLYFEIIGFKLLLLATIIAILFSYLTKKHVKIPVFHLFLDHFQRESERKEIPARGLIFYLMGATITVLLFPGKIALASIMILALGDSVSRLVGPFGYVKHPFNNAKFIEGVLAGLILGALGALLFVPLPCAFIAAAFSMFLEAFDIRINKFKVDDNLLIPISSGIIIYLSLKMLY